MYKEIFLILKKNGIKIEKPLSSSEICQIEKVYNIQFPLSLKKFYSIALPVSNGFYNWRNFSSENISNIQSIINTPYFDVYNMAEDVYWNDNWGIEPTEETIKINEVRKRLAKAPKLIPIFSHRYIPELYNDPPVISISGVDVVYYGKNLKDYFNVEFGRRKLFLSLNSFKEIPFWSEIM
jgi:hypothetical protein